MTSPKILRTALIACSFLSGISTSALAVTTDAAHAARSKLEKASVFNETPVVVPSPVRQVSLATLHRGHPRLVFTQERLDVLRQRIKTDRLLAGLVEYTRQRSDEIAAGPTVEYKPVIPFNEFGMLMLSLNRAIQERAVVHAFMYRLTGERKYADRLWREVETSLSYPTWNPAVTLDVAEMLVGMAIAYDWAYDAWTPEQRQILRKAIIERGINGIVEVHEKRSGPSAAFPTTTSNWNAVGNAGLLAGALAIAEDEPEIAKRALGYAVPSLGYSKSNFEPDGGNDEGPSYWSYGVDYFTLASAMLKSALGDDAGLLEGKAFAGSALYRLHVQSTTGRNWTYADSWPYSDTHFGYTVLATKYGPTPALQDIRQTFSTFLESPARIRDQEKSVRRLYPLAYLWLPPEQPASAFNKVPLDAFFGGTAHLAMMRGAWGDPMAAYIGFKAGKVDHSHNHLDAGSFLFDQGGVRWSADLGPENYEIFGYFRKESNKGLPWNAETRNMTKRWDFLRANNYGHSTLTLGGDLQERTAFAPFIAKGSKPQFTYTVADLSEVYPLRAKHWQRGIALVDRSWVAVRDELKGLQPNITAEWVMMTEAEVSIAPDGRSATLSKDAAKLNLILAIAPQNARITAAPALPRTKEETQNHGIIRVVVSWQSLAKDEVLEVHLVPATFKDKTATIGQLAQWNKK